MINYNIIVLCFKAIKKKDDTIIISNKFHFYVEKRKDSPEGLSLYAYLNLFLLLCCSCCKLLLKSLKCPAFRDIEGFPCRRGEICALCVVYIEQR